MAHRAVMGFFFFRHPHIPSIPPHTLFTAHASRTHVKAPQTDFHSKPDNSSGPTHDSLPEMPLRMKVTFQPKQAPKSIEKQIRERTTQAKHGPTLLPASFQVENRAKARRAASRPRRIPPRRSEPWRDLRSHQVRLHGSMPQSSKPSRLSFDRSKLRIPVVGIGSPPGRNAGPSGSRLTFLIH